MDKELFLAGAKSLVEVNGRVKKGERVVIVSDNVRLHHAHYVEQAVKEKGADVELYSMSRRSHHGQEPPVHIAEAMRGADIIFSPVDVSITHTIAMRNALEAGARAILMTSWTDDIFACPALMKTDFEAQAHICRKWGDTLKSGNHVRLTSPKGTELTFSIEGRKANVLTNIPGPGELAPVPDIEVNVVPIEGTANGTLIADASVPYLGIGVLDEPVVCTIKDGFITEMKGGSQADILLADLMSHGDPNCLNIAELGIGLNPNARLTGVMLDDEGVLGTIHIGIGTNYTLGGNVVAPTHYDLLMWDPTIIVDNVIIQEKRTIHL
ncbi:leucyl aminopeptidase [bacterium]|nr:leucyl aminopeptidase [bacterium]